MTSRLSEESLKAVLDAGQQGLVIQSDRVLDALVAPAVDLDALLNAENPEEAVQAVAPQPLFQALMQRGPEDALDVLPLLSAEQVVRILDYDAWHEDRLEPLKAIRWLNLFKELGAEELYKRFRGLDEEYQLALMGPLVEMFDEDEYEEMGQAEQDALHRMPCSTLFYRIKSEDMRLEEFVTGLIEAALDSDIGYAYSLLAHASYMPPNEQEAMIGQFRRARLEEDGFVSFEESLKAFQPVDLEQLRRTWGFELHRETAALTAYADDTGEPFLKRVLAAGDGGWTAEESSAVQQGLAFLANSLCAVAHVEVDDRTGLRLLLQQAQATVSLGLEYLAGGDVRAARAILRREHPQVLFRAGIALVRRLSEAVIDQLAEHEMPDADKLLKNLTLDKRGELELTLERALSDLLGFERTELLKGLFNRFPVRPVAVIEDESGIKRVTFQPIASLAQLSSLAASVDQLTGMLHLAALTDHDDHAATQPVDKRLCTGLARMLLGEGFRYAPLSSADVARLVQLPTEAAQMLTADFFAGVEGSLRMSRGWAASRKAGVPVTDPVQSAMADFSDLVMRLAAAREHARLSGGDPKAGLSGLVAVVDGDTQEGAR